MVGHENVSTFGIEVLQPTRSHAVGGVLYHAVEVGDYEDMLELANCVYAFQFAHYGVHRRVGNDAPQYAKEVRHFTQVPYHFLHFVVSEWAYV